MHRIRAARLPSARAGRLHQFTGAPGPPVVGCRIVWTVTSVGGSSWMRRTRHMDFAADGTLSGTTGCNQFNGTYTVDGSS